VKRIIQPCGPSLRDDGAALYLKRWLNRVPGVTYDRMPVTKPISEWGEYDAVIYVDWAEDAVLRGRPAWTPDPGKPSLCWQSDLHWTPSGRTYRLEQSAAFQLVAFCQRSETLPAEGVTCAARWLPHAADHLVYHPLLTHPLSPDDPSRWDPSPSTFQTIERIPRWDLCFVGHAGDPGREEALERMFAAIPNFCFRPGVFFEAAADVYHWSRIVFNPSVRHDLNMRTFEALAARSFLLADRQDGMDALGLKHGEHCLIYDTTEEAIELAREWSDPSKDRKRIEIADSGWRWCLAHHTYYHRARTMLAWLIGNTP